MRFHINYLCLIGFGICNPVAITGTYGRSIDQKLRLAIPRQLREGLDVSDGGELYLAPGLSLIHI